MLFILPNLRSGGAERIIVNIANRLCTKVEYRVSLLLMNQEEMFFRDQLDSRIGVTALNFASVKKLLLSPVTFYRAIKQHKPHIVFSGYGELNVVVILFSFLFPKVRFIARETSVPSRRVKNWILLFLYKNVYHFYRYIIVQSDSMHDDLMSTFGIKSDKLVKIYNPVDEDQLQVAATENCLEKTAGIIEFIYVGTIDQQKNLRSIISFFEKITDVETNTHLSVIGDGPLRKEIEEQINNSPYKTRISMHGFQKNPYRFICKADFLIIASEYEGYPNAGIEANFFGVPVLLSDKTAGGAAELVKPGFNGELIDFAQPDFSFLQKKYDKDAIRSFIKNRHSYSVNYAKVRQLID